MTQTLHPLILVRHGQAEHQVQAITGGWTDTALTSVGVEQARLLGRRLRRELVGLELQLGASCLKRAVQTAGILAEALGLEPEVLPQLTDLNNGAAAGKTHTEARALQLPESEPLFDWRSYPQAETWREFYTRITTFMQEFTARQSTAAILVTHFANIDVMTMWWLGLPLEARTHFEIAPASLTVLTISRYHERAVERLNDTAHLYTRRITEPMRLYHHR